MDVLRNKTYHLPLYLEFIIYIYIYIGYDHMTDCKVNIFRFKTINFVNK